MKKNLIRFFLPFILGGCDKPNETPQLPVERWEHKFENIGKLLDKDISLMGKDQEPTLSDALWYGSLESLRNFPMKIVDGSGGVLQTDWYVMPQHPQERFQVRVTIQPSVGIDVQALKVIVIKQIYQHQQWENVTPSEVLGNAIKHDILLNARTYAVTGKRKSIDNR